MLSWLEQQQGLVAVAVDHGRNPHAYCDWTIADHPAHYARPFGEIDKHDVMGRFGGSLVDDGHCVNRPLATCLDPLPIVVASFGLSGSRRKKMCSTGARALQHEAVVTKHFAPLFFGSHRTSLWARRWAVK